MSHQANSYTFNWQDPSWKKKHLIYLGKHLQNTLQHPSWRKNMHSIILAWAVTVTVRHTFTTPILEGKHAFNHSSSSIAWAGTVMHTLTTHILEGKHTFNHSTNSGMSHWAYTDIKQPSRRESIHSISIIHSNFYSFSSSSSTLIEWPPSTFCHYLGWVGGRGGVPHRGKHKHFFL